jgi:hypothetical protein
MLEWESPDVIVSSAKVQDMDGYELFTLVRKHPTTLDTPFLLLAGGDRPTALAAAEAGVNMVLTGAVALDVIVARVAELLKDGAEPEARPIRRIESAGNRRAVEPLWAAVEKGGGKLVPSPGAASLQGSLDVMDLAEVTQAIALGGKTGSLVVAFSAGEGRMLFQVGRLPRELRRPDWRRCLSRSSRPRSVSPRPRSDSIRWVAARGCPSPRPSPGVWTSCS